MDVTSRIKDVTSVSGPVTTLIRFASYKTDETEVFP
jgi:hypothetical protein